MGTESPENFAERIIIKTKELFYRILKHVIISMQQRDTFGVKAMTQ